MKIRNILPLIFVAVHFTLNAQENEKPAFSKAIEDNLYLNEEAYNQEDRVVQHISNFTFSNEMKDFQYSFTQEWPFFGQKHQLSYTIGFSSFNSFGITGINDVMLNYRYQLTGHDDFVTMSPRLSVIIPSGNKTKGIGDGVWGYQFNLPISKRISEGFVCHANIGYTLLPHVETTTAENNVYTNTHSTINIGLSPIWLVSQKFNLIMEVLYNISREADENNNMVTLSQILVSPGFRYAIDIKGLQIVPGAAMPITFENNKTSYSAFFYLSFEHPF